MEYQYYNQFHLSDKLLKALSSIISKNEENDYECRILTLTISEETYCYFVVMKNEFYKMISKQTFENEEELNGALKMVSIFSEEYDGIFDSEALTEKFTYLQDFFNSLDNWRAQAGRVTIDDDVLNMSLKRTLCKKETIN